MISVVMPVLNGEKHLREAMESVLKQTFTDFEFIIINDGSTDTTAEIIKAYNDPRIVYIDNGANLGLAKSFNIGIQAARGIYIARMDADDISIKDRFARQVRYLEMHPDVGVLGSAAIRIDLSGKKLGKISRPTNHLDIKWRSLFSTPLIHPTVIARSEVLKNNPFDETLHNSEDYELWSRLLFTTDTRFANLPEPLLLYREAGFTQNLDKSRRAVSAGNTISNIERYTLVGNTERDVLILLRQDERLSLEHYWTIWHLYFRAAENFTKKEGLGLPATLAIFGSLSSVAIFLLKYDLKHL
jgi:glycosyltransferase involved in cell wall biosynthesis